MNYQRPLKRFNKRSDVDPGFLSHLNKPHGDASNYIPQLVELNNQIFVVLFPRREPAASDLPVCVLPDNSLSTLDEHVRFFDGVSIISNTDTRCLPLSSLHPDQPASLKLSKSPCLCISAN